MLRRRESAAGRRAQQERPRCSPLRCTVSRVPGSSEGENVADLDPEAKSLKIASVQPTEFSRWHRRGPSARRVDRTTDNSFAESLPDDRLRALWIRLAHRQVGLNTCPNHQKHHRPTNRARTTARPPARRITAAPEIPANRAAATTIGPGARANADAEVGADGIAIKTAAGPATLS